LRLESRDATIHDVKRAVIDEFQRVDRRVDVQVTDYFRHTYIPDLVLRWGDDIDRPERWVFLRSKVYPSYLTEDVSTLAPNQPIIFGLAPTPIEGGKNIERVKRLRERSAAAGTLVTDPAGLDRLSSPSEDEPSSISELVSRQIIRGGRGLYDEQTSADTTRTINVGFQAAFDTDAEATFRAAISIRERLGEKSGERLLRLLHAIWVGSGGRSDQFPDAPVAEGPLSDDALELLISGPDIEDVGFWRRLGVFSLPQLGRLKLADRPANLARLVTAHADGIHGRWCRVRPDEPRTGSDNSVQWGVEAGTLALHGPTFSAYLAEERSALAQVGAVEAETIQLTDLTKRAERAEAVISDVTAAGEGLIVEVASDTHGNLLDNPRASGTVQAAAGNITRATATLRNRRSVVCDFRSTTASSRTRATLTLRELVRHGLPLVWNLAEDEMQRLAEILAPVTALTETGNGNQMSLLDLLDESDDSADDRPSDS
jgi:hypothetical protein